MILQHVYRPILNFIYDKITFRLNDRTRKFLLFLCFFAIFAVQFAAQYIFKFQGLNRGIRDYFICLMMGIIILVSVDRKLEVVKWNLWTYVPFTITGLLLLIASLDHEMGPAYQAFPLAMLVAFMCLFYVWGNRRDYEVLFDAMAGAYSIFITVLLLLCLIKYPAEYFSYSDQALEYAPFDINPNGVAKIFLVGITASLYLVSRVKLKFLFWWTSLVMGGCGAIVLLTKCRAGFVVLFLIVVVGILYIVLNLKREKIYRKNIVKKMSFCMILVVCGFGLVCFSLFSISPRLYKAVNSNSSMTQSEIEAANFAEKLADDKAFLRRIEIEKKLEASQQELKASKLYKMDGFLAGRITLWNIYYENMTWKGSSELLFYDTEYAHNQYIELSYKAGIPTGIIYLIFNLIAGILALVMFFKRKDAVGLLSLSAFIVFFIISMLDTGVLPFERGFIFLYYITLTPLFFRKDKKKLL